ncbi:MAG: hypothetical protein EXS14_08050 [Planctomycetes bacterium]|nr:hypothetical protein [Planctomycetota bacterium]
MIRTPAGDFAVPPDGNVVALQTWLHALQSSAALFHWRQDRAGIDLACAIPVAEQPNRARLKLFAPDMGVMVAFFYKESQVPFSTDRFAYGAMIHRRCAPTESECAASVVWMLSGLHPEQRPEGIKRAFPFDIPR